MTVKAEKQEEAKPFFPFSSVVCVTVTTMQKSGKLLSHHLHFLVIKILNESWFVVVKSDNMFYEKEEKCMTGQKDRILQTYATCQWPSGKPSLLSGRSIFVFFDTTGRTWAFLRVGKFETAREGFETGF